MLTGAGLLWMGWTGFNGGDPYVVSLDASLAVLNTHVCTATSLLTWLALDVIFFRKPSVIGAVQGMITGLVCITPAAGKYFTKRHETSIYVLSIKKLVQIVSFICIVCSFPNKSFSGSNDYLINMVSEPMVAY